MFKEGDRVVLNPWDELTRGKAIGVPKCWFDAHCGEEFTVVNTDESEEDLRVRVMEIDIAFPPDVFDSANPKRCSVDDSLTSFLLGIM